MCSGGGGDVSSFVTGGSFSSFQSKFNLKIYRDNELYFLMRESSIGGAYRGSSIFDLY